MVFSRLSAAFSRLNAVPISTLVGIAGIGGMATSVFGYYTRQSIQWEWAKKPFYKDAIKALRWRLIQKHSCPPFFYPRELRLDGKDLQFEIT